MKTWYLAFCVQCNGGIEMLIAGDPSVLPMPFDQNAARTAWVDEHMEGTDHAVLLMNQRDKDPMTQRRRNERGAAAVEFALVMPILLMIVFAIISFGFIFAQDLALSNGSRQAARYAAVQGHSCTLIKEQAVAASKPLVTMVPGDVDVYLGTKPPGEVGGASQVCTGDQSIEPCEGSGIDDNLYITATFEADVLVPVFPGMGSTMTIDGEGVFRCEFS